MRLKTINDSKLAPHLAFSQAISDSLPETPTGSGFFTLAGLQSDFSSPLAQTLRPGRRPPDFKTVRRSQHRQSVRMVSILNRANLGLDGQLNKRLGNG
jgi:hypothetical protein